MPTPESKVKAAVKKALAAHNVYAHWPVQNGMGAPCLDCHGCSGGRYFAVETKAPGKKPTPRQEKTIEDIQRAGGTVFVISGSDGIVAFSAWLALTSYKEVGHER